MATDRDQQHRYTIDIRVFLCVMTVSMAGAFLLGVGMGPSVSSQPELPEVTSVQLNPVLPTDDSGLHEPAGQHLLVDIKGIESDFLDSEARLAKAMSDTIDATGLTMLSYHCHSLVPKGVSCVGVLLESHISFHTWPDEGVITLDLFTCGSKPLIPAVKIIQDLFGIGEDIQIQWSHELRGFRKKDAEGKANIDHNSDLSQLVWSPIDSPVKEQIVSTMTKYQRVDIWDLVGLDDTPSNSDAIKNDLQPGDPRWLTHELVTPARYLFLDGVLQSTSDSHREYHEAMVHPGMFSHPSPQNVAIVGGGEGATLREILKHKTVKSVTMIEIDEELVDLAKEHLPSMSDCADLVGRADNCFEDESTTLVFEDAKQWFADRYGLAPSKQVPEEKFDVVIVDAVEPEIAASLSRDLYKETSALSSIMKSLSPEGILAIQIGRAPTILDPRPDIGYNAHREVLFQALESLPEAEAMFVYEDPHSGFMEPRAFMVVCRSVSCRSRFYATSDVIDYQIYDRIVRTHSKARALAYFDGITHLGYQVAPKAWETVYCRREPTPFECAYRHLDFAKGLFEFNAENEDDGAFKITADYGDDGIEIKQTHVLANVDIPKGSYIMPEHLASSLILSDETIENLRGNMQYGGVTVIEDFVEFVDEFGHESKAVGSGRKLVEIGASYMIRSVETESEANVGRWMPPHPNGKRPKYSPVYERHRLSFDVFMVASKDITKGSELLKFNAMWDKE